MDSANIIQFRYHAVSQIKPNYKCSVCCIVILWSCICTFLFNPIQRMFNVQVGRLSVIETNGARPPIRNLDALLTLTKQSEAYNNKADSFLNRLFVVLLTVNLLLCFESLNVGNVSLVDECCALDVLSTCKFYENLGRLAEHWFAVGIEHQ